MGLTSRRGMLLGVASALGACRRRKAEGFPGYAFVANSAGEAVAVVDLDAFAIARHIRLAGDPVQLVSHPSWPRVYALTAGTGSLHEIDTETLTLARSARFADSASSMRLSPDGDAIWLVDASTPALLRIDTRTFRTERRIRLPDRPVDWDLAPDGRSAAFALGSYGSVVMDLANGGLRTTEVSGSVDIIRYRSDGRQLLAGDRTTRTLSIIDAVSAGLVVSLPLAVAPRHFCFKPDGGQLFITGDGMDAVVTVHPYQTQIASTTLAGRLPGPMAASADPNYLFIANPDAGDVTVLSIDTQRVMAVVAVGRRPTSVTVTPDNRYALVLNEDSGDMAVIRIETLTGRRRKLAPLFMLVPVGSRPVDVVVRIV